MILDKFPDPDEFYKTYWGRKPFVVRRGIDPSLFEGFIDGDTLAGLSLEEEIKSRIIITAPEGGQWQCEHGPFEESRFSALGDYNWSLLVQNVDRYHPETAALLEHFNFSPRWLLDDIMVSYSTVGGSVGPHTDSYHVFLVQGIGRRSWRIANDPIENEECIEGLDLKVLKDGFDGQEVEVTVGDVIYLPPNFAHEGVTLEEAMTFSVGFLGPKISELFIEYGYYLEEMETDNARYLGQGLNAQSAGVEVTSQASSTICHMMKESLELNNFERWLVQYFARLEPEEDEGEYEQD